MQDKSLRHQRAGQDRSGALWLIQAFSGLLLVALLLLHMVAHHFVVEGGLREFRQVVDYVSHPAIFIITIIFLVVVTAHTILGLRAILIDLRPSLSTRRFIDWLLLAIGVSIVIYGIWLEAVIARL